MSEKSNQAIGDSQRIRSHQRTATGYIPDDDSADLSQIFPGDESNAVSWRIALENIEKGLKSDPLVIVNSIVNNIFMIQGRAGFNVDELSIYLAVASTVRDRLIKRWNKTQQYYTQKKLMKRAYYFSLEYLMGRSLDNSLINLDVKEEYKQAISNLGFNNIEDILDAEHDAGLGNGGLGRLAACYADSATTLNLPFFSYGLRYQYGIFRQIISSRGAQIEVPDPWLENSNPWELVRLDSTVEVKFGTDSEAIEVLAVPYDVPIPGYKTGNVSNLRLWSAKPKKAFDLASFNAGDYQSAISEAEAAENITRVLYPNDDTDHGKTLRLKQQFLWVSASLQDIVRRFKKSNLPWIKFPDLVAIQLNDTHPTLAIVELLRILVDESNVNWNEAWSIVTRTFSYTNHTILPEALEKQSVTLLSKLLPRHLQLIFDINFYFLQKVETKFSGDHAKIARMSLIMEGETQYVRMSHLAIIGSHKVNGVAELHSKIVKEMFSDFVEFLGQDHFTNITNGICRRWILVCNPKLSALITDSLGNDDWLLDFYKLKGIEKFVDDKKFVKKWSEIKQDNKNRLADFIKSKLGISINRSALFDIQAKRFHLYKRQLMNILAIVYRYLILKKLSSLERQKVVPRVFIFSGKAASGYYNAKLIIQLINSVGKIINEDLEMRDLLSVVFIPDYSVSISELLVSASDISQHISTAGTEASGTSNMKFALNGGLILGTFDGANIEISEEVGQENVFFFGHLAEDVPALRRAHQFDQVIFPSEIQLSINAIRSGTFGAAGVFEPLLDTLYGEHDYYLLSDDFTSYLEAQAMVDKSYLNKESWRKKTIHTVANMGKFSSDRSVAEYAERIWNIEPAPVSV